MVRGVASVWSEAGTEGRVLTRLFFFNGVFEHLGRALDQGGEVDAEHEVPRAAVLADQECLQQTRGRHESKTWPRVRRTAGRWRSSGTLQEQGGRVDRRASPGRTGDSAPQAMRHPVRAPWLPSLNFSFAHRGGSTQPMFPKEFCAVDSQARGISNGSPWVPPQRCWVVGAGSGVS